MTGVRRPLRQVLAPPAQRPGLDVSHYSLDALNVPAGIVVGSQQERTVMHVRGPNHAVEDRLALDRTKAYLFALRMPSATSQDRLSSLTVYRRYNKTGQAALQTDTLLAIQSGSSNEDDKMWLWALGPSDFATTMAGGVNNLIFNVITGARGGRSYSNLSAVPFWAAVWG